MKSRVTALFVLPSFAGKGGIQRFNRTLVHVCATQQMEMMVLSLVDSTDAAKSAMHYADASARGANRSRLRFFFAALWFLSTRRWDMVFIGHVNLARMVSVMLPFTRSRRARTLMIAHGIDVWGCISGTLAAAVCKMWRVLAVSEYTCQSVLAQVPGLREENCLVFPNALSESWKEQQSAGAEGKMSLPRNFALSVTRLAGTERYKGIVTTIESITGWQDPELMYVVAGGGDDLGFLRRVAQRCGVADRVIFMGAVSDAQLGYLYRQAGMFLLPSGKEGFGIVFLEAMYFEVPVVAASSRGAVDVARDGKTAALVRYGDVVGMADAVNRITTDAALRARIVSGGKALVTGDGEFTEMAMQVRWKSLIREALA